MSAARAKSKSKGRSSSPGLQRAKKRSASRATNVKGKSRQTEEKFTWILPKRGQLKSLIQGRVVQLKDFQLGECIGSGTFGFVRLVKLRHTEDGNPPPMALKIMKKADLLALHQVEHVKAEKKLLEFVDSPFVITFLASFQDDRRVFLLTEYIHGGELYERLRREGRLPVDHCKFYAAQLVLALQYLHELDIVYRDIKPENVLLDRHGNVKLCDFGFAKTVKDKTYTLVGTPEYLAPEIIESRGHGKPADFWALGVLIFEMMAGYPPFFEKSPYDMYKKILNGKFVFPRHFCRKAKHLIARLLIHDPSKRYAKMDCMMHIWFDYVDWKLVQETKIHPPYTPHVEEPDDLSNFEIVEEEDTSDAFEKCPPISKKENRHFQDLF